MKISVVILAICITACIHSCNGTLDYELCGAKPMKYDAADKVKIQKCLAAAGVKEMKFLTEFNYECVVKCTLTAFGLLDNDGGPLKDKILAHATKVFPDDSRKIARDKLSGCVTEGVDYYISLKEHYGAGQSKSERCTSYAMFNCIIGRANYCLID